MEMKRALCRKSLGIINPYVFYLKGSEVSTPSLFFDYLNYEDERRRVALTNTQLHEDANIEQ